MKSNENFLNVTEDLDRIQIRHMTHFSDSDYYAPTVIAIMKISLKAGGE